MEGSQSTSRPLKQLKNFALRKKQSNGTTTLRPGSTDRYSRSRSPISTSTAAPAATASETDHGLTREPIPPRDAPQSAENTAPSTPTVPANQVSTMMTANIAMPLSKAPIWTKTLSTFEAENKDDYDVLVAIHQEIANSVADASQPINFVTPNTLIKPENKVQHALITRLKGYLPSLAASKAILTTFARLDPHQIAPYLVAGLFFVIEVSVTAFLIPAFRKEDGV
jgi:hypothetical protein